MSIASLCSSMDDTLARKKIMHGHVSKRVKMQRKPTGGTNKHGKCNIAMSGKREGYAWSDQASRDAS